MRGGSASGMQKSRLAKRLNALKPLDKTGRDTQKWQGIFYSSLNEERPHAEIADNRSAKVHGLSAV